jgi:hypothetical protein
LTPGRIQGQAGVFSDLFYAGSRGVDRCSHGIDLLLAERPAREAQSQRKLQVFHRAQNLRCGAAAVGATGLDHASKKGIHCPAVGVEECSALRRKLVQLLRTIAGADRHVAATCSPGWITANTKSQAKRYKSIAAGDVKTIVTVFQAGAWKDKSDRLVLAVQASLADTKLQDEIETQAGALKSEGITFVPHGGEELSEALRGHPDLVDDFFGRGWVEAFLGSETAKALSARLDGAEFARVRAQLRRFYDAHFHLLDVGVALPLAMDEVAQKAPPSLLRRFTVPDVLVPGSAIPAGCRRSEHQP